MQSGSEATGNGKSPVQSPARSWPSSSAVPNSGRRGFESNQQNQQQQWQLLQQIQQVRNAEGEDTLFAHQSGSINNGMGGNNFLPSSSAISHPHSSVKFSEIPHQNGPSLLREEHYNQGQGVGQHLPDPIHQVYFQYGFQAAQPKPNNVNMPPEQQGKIGIVGQSWRGQEMLGKNLKMQDLMHLQTANQKQLSIPKKSIQDFANSDKQIDQGNSIIDQRNDLNYPQITTGQFISPNTIRPVQPLQSTPSMQNTANSQVAMTQFQAMHTWAQEHNNDPSLPVDVNLIAQVLPHWQSVKKSVMLTPNETSAVTNQPYLPPSKQHLISSPAGSENSAHGNSLSDLSGQAGPQNSWPIRTGGSAGNSSNGWMPLSQLSAHCRENHNEKAGRPVSAIVNRLPVMHLPQSTAGMCQSLDHSDTNNAFAGNATLTCQQFKPVQQLMGNLSNHLIPSSVGVNNEIPSQGGNTQVTQQHIGFTKHQLYVLKAQILAFKRLKRGECALPQEVLQAIVPLPLDSQLQHTFLPSGMVRQERSALNNVEEHSGYAEVNDKAPQLAPLSKGHDLRKDESFTAEEKTGIINQLQIGVGSSKEPVQVESAEMLEQDRAVLLKSEPEVEGEGQQISTEVYFSGDKGKALPMHSANMDPGKLKIPIPASSIVLPKDVATRKYHGPLFDFPSFVRQHDSLGSTTVNYPSNLTLAYDVKDILLNEGMDMLNKKRADNLKKISGLLAVNLERKRVSPDLVLRMQIEEKKLKLYDLQARLKDEVNQQQQEIMAMSDRPYRKFVRQCEYQRIELIRQVQQLKKVSRDKHLKSVFQWRKKLLEAHWGIRDARIARNRGVAKYHERMLREFSKKKDEDRNKRMEALKNNDVDRYREMLLEQQMNVPGDASQRYAVLSSFLSQTEEYLHKLGGKIAATKNHQEVEEAANVAATAARSQGLSEEEVKTAAACAREEVVIRNRFSEMNAPKGDSSINKYYNLAHAVNEKVIRQPSMLRSGMLRDYQLVGLQWMLSLYNNKLNGILADEMGLGKTVQVMALIAYLMEFKGNYGPHLIIVPNAVLVNWKSELLSWLPSLSCVFYVGAKDQRSKLFSYVQALKFNVLVTTYEFVMYDRSKLSKIEWKYIIIDEAQRMKDRESVLARDLDRYRCHRRLLLTGTPLQNDLRELWSLLNLLLPEVFDNSKAFHEWFSKPFQKDGPSHSPEEDDWLETEKKVIIIHRLHQILEPFMLRRRVEDVEGSLPPKVSVVLRCRMSAIQSAMYDWIKSTGTIRVDPEEELRKVEKNPMYQVKMHKNLNNKCMELRKVCNHPLLNYPYFNDYSKEFIVRSCGKLWILDRILIKLQSTGHRVLLFSTMTKLLDLLEEYLQWRRLVYRRIDGTTSLEDRESAIMDFNGPDSDCFIFLLSIRAAGRGLNLQSADTVVIYDPDPNPQNEAQAVARAHRIGQKREVKVIYMEAVVNKISSHEKEDELRHGGTEDSEDDLAGKDRYVGSIESLIRSNIQQYKIDMADEVINAGRFDQRTTHEERRMTLETLLHDEERYQETVHDVPSLQEVNRLIARSEEEIELFDQMDEEFDWTREMVEYNEVPKWLRSGSREVNALVANSSKKSSKKFAGSTVTGSGELFSGQSPSKTERRSGRPKGLTTTKEYSMYRDLDDEDDDSAVSSKSDASFLREGEEEIGVLSDETSNDAMNVVPNNKHQLGEERMICDGGYEFSRMMDGSRGIHLSEEAGSTGSSSGSRRLPQPVSPSLPSQKFESLLNLDARPDPFSKRTPDELEEGEIAASSYSHMDLQQSGSCAHDHHDGEDGQVQQPKLKRKRSIRARPRYIVEKLEERSNNGWVLSRCGSQLPVRGGHDIGVQFRTDPDPETFRELLSDKHYTNASSLKQKGNLPVRKVSPASMQNNGRGSFLSESAKDGTEHSRRNLNPAIRTGVPSFLGTKMSDSTQRKCKNVISKFQRRIDKEGHQIIPTLHDFSKRNASSSFPSPVGVASNLLDLQRIEQNVDNLEYNNATEFIEDVQFMLKNLLQQCNSSYEMKREAGNIQDIFFDIVKIAFPDMNFQESRNSVAVSNPRGAASTPRPNRSPVNQPRPMNETGEQGRARTKSQKEPMVGRASPLLAHLGDLVICKKKRKERDKPRQRSGPMSPPLSDPGRAAASPPSNTGRSVGSAHPTRQPAQGLLHLGEGRWDQPVKKTRTDVGRRRPSHL